MSKEYIDKGIRINKGQRRWHKYGSKILAICIAAAAAIAIIAIAANIGRGGSNNTSGDNNFGGTDNNQAAVTTTSSAESDKTESETAKADGKETTSEEENESTTSTEKTDESESVKGGTVSGKAKEEEYTSEDFFKNTAFVGDIFVYGIDEYEYIPSSNLYSATFMTAAKAMDLVEDISAEEPEKIFVMLGFDDDNLTEDRTAQTSADAILELLEELKSKNPEADIYAVSEIPISEEYDSDGDDYVTQADLDEINNLVKKGASSMGIGYIDVASSLKDGEYLSTDYSNDGCHVMKQYYPFVLNGIAAVAK